MIKLSTRKLKDAAYISVFAFSLLVILGNLMLLYDNFTTQRLNYLETDDFVWIGFLMVGFIIINFLITRRFMRRAKKRSR